MTAQFTIPDNWAPPPVMAFEPVERRLDQRLIPPGVNDARARRARRLCPSGGFVDFRRLLARTSAEMTAEELPLALYERALNKYVGPDGLPEPVVRQLIDHAFVLHGLEGTDQGVRLALALHGFDSEIVHWFQQEPEGAHDTQRVIIHIESSLYPGEAAGGPKARAQLTRVVEATKRFSQDTAIEWLFTGRARLNVGASVAVIVDVLVPAIQSEPTPGEAELGVGVSASVVISITAGP